MEQVNILDNGFIRLVGCNADDLSVVNSARVSFGKQSNSLSEQDIGLINYLMREKHGTPFEHNFFSFHIKAPIFVTREWFRHRIGWSYNEFSARYSEMPEQWYTPNPEDIRSQVGKPGSYTFEPLENTTAQEIFATINMANERSYKTYNYLLKQGVAKELARTVLPVGGYTEFYASTNARALMNFITLRSAENAQYEIRQYAKSLEIFLEQKMPTTYKAFISNNKVAP